MSHRTKPGQRAPNSKAGRNEFKCTNYSNRKKKYANKFARVLKNSGLKAALAYEKLFK